MIRRTKKDEKKDKKDKDKKTDQDKDKKGKKDKDKKDKDKDANAKAKSKQGQRDLDRAKALLASDGEESKDEGKEKEEELEEKRDPKKMYHFNKSLRLLPEAVRKMFESREVSRADKTKLVNQVVEERDDGKFVVNPNAPVISVLSKSYTNVVGQELLDFSFCFMFPPWKFCILGFCCMFRFLFCTFFFNRHP